MKKRSKGGFTLAELLVVVAIIGVLVAISIPIFSAQIHKAEVATDWANIRAYYSEIQADFISTGEYNPKVPIWVDSNSQTYDYTSFTFLSGQKVTLKAGTYAVTKESNGRGYQIAYNCSIPGHSDDDLVLNTSNGTN